MYLWMEYRMWQNNLTILQMCETASLKEVREKDIDIGQPWWLRGLAPPSAQGVILETRDQILHRAPCMDPALPLPLPLSLSLCLCLFMRDTHTQRERERHKHRQREKQAPCREPDGGLHPGSLGSHPGPKAELNRWATRAALKLLSYFPKLLGRRLLSVEIDSLSHSSFQFIRTISTLH